MWLVSKKHIRSYNSPFPSIRCHFFRITPRNVQLLFRPERRVWTFDGKRPTVKNHLIHPDWKKHVPKRKHFSQRALRVKGILSLSFVRLVGTFLGKRNSHSLILVTFQSKILKLSLGSRFVVFSQDTKDSYLARDLCFLPKHLSVMPARLKGTDMELRL